MERAEVIVIGLGAMGSATCRALACRGAEVIGIDRYAPPHPHGSTHGETRITRLAIGEGAEYVPLVQRSHRLWRELEGEAGVELMRQTGGLILGPPNGAFLRDTRAVAARYGIAHENLSPEEIRRRFPTFTIDSDTEGYFEPEAGYVRPEAAVRVQLERARQNGARLRRQERVLSWSATADSVTVITDRDTFAAERLVLAVGPWLPSLLPEAAGAFAVHRQLQYWFPMRERHEAFARMPVFVWDFGAAASGFVHLVGFYGFPAVDGPDGGVKLATESYEARTTADGRQHPASAREADVMYRSVVAPHLPWLAGPPLRTVSCLYTSTRGSRFVVDSHPEHDRVMIVSACSGHGFKHSPAIGEAVAQRLLGEPATVDLSPFTLGAVSTV